MCLAVPCKIIGIEGEEALVAMSGVTLRISIMLTPEARPGDYVLVHAGFSINIVNKEEAEETLRLFDQLQAQAG